MKKKKVITILKKLNIRASKRLGQSFLLDEEIAERQIDYANLKNDDIVLEIGPGLGILTKKIREKANLIAIEKDKRFYSFLKTNFPNIDIISGNALKIDFPKFNKIISNLPFQISSPITFKFFEYKFDIAILMYQKEFAKRIVSLPPLKSYSRISVAMYYKADCEILEIVPKTAFYPTPKVDSAIVKIMPGKPKFKVLDEQTFFDVTKAIFNQRRKIIRNSLKSYFGEKIDDILDELPKKRGEELMPEEIGELSNLVFDVLKQFTLLTTTSTEECT